MPSMLNPVIFMSGMSSLLLDTAIGSKTVRPFAEMKQNLPSLVVSPPVKYSLAKSPLPLMWAMNSLVELSYCQMPDDVAHHISPSDDCAMCFTDLS